ncbi:hypothetical protein L1987_01869 [Smallanthus sonchifolius]|uniref:Uncharacterized protein n=1 Tax=Smallanthus sonchifolius TaxID=185202 RepID=A0ACB9K6E9_9ASTR|nr:hypothetical protein L1987_01869 [Smallanthus sonchifolius]
MFTKVTNERICHYSLGNEGYGYGKYVMGLYLLGAFVASQLLYNWGDDGVPHPKDSTVLMGLVVVVFRWIRMKMVFYIHQTKYVADILKKFEMTDASAFSTPIPVNHKLDSDSKGKDVDFQAEGISSDRYSDYGGCSLDRKSTSGGCQFLRNRLVSWQCKKQTSVAISTCEAEYIVAANCCSQILWIQQQLRDYGLSFTEATMLIDNTNTMSITNNPVKHSKTKHIEIHHHFIRDCVEKRLIELVKVHTDDNFADLFTKAFDRSRFEFLTKMIGMYNPY